MIHHSTEKVSIKHGILIQSDSQRKMKILNHS